MRNHRTHLHFLPGVRALLMMGIIVTCSTAKSTEAVVWDAIKQFYQAFQLGEIDEENIPQTPVEHVWEIGLMLQGKIELSFDEETPGIGSIRWMGITPEGSLLLTDETAQQAHEFSLDDGGYVRSFGRQGKGPGEYDYAENMTVDSENRVYLFDSSKVLRYDRQGNYLDMTRFIGGSLILAGRSGGLFFLGVNLRNIMELQYRDPATWEMVYRTPLSTEKQDFISYRMGGIAQLCYSNALHRLFYLGPNDYMVKEIDAATGEILRQFGRRPEGFISLPERYYNIGRGSFEDMRQLQMSKVRSMTLLKDRYLLISYSITLHSLSWEGVLYDLSSSSRIKAYDLNNDAKELLESFRYRTPWGSIAAWQDRLYLWNPPTEEAVETSNGTIHVLFFDTN